MGVFVVFAQKLCKGFKIARFNDFELIQLVYKHWNAVTVYYIQRIRIRRFTDDNPFVVKRKINAMKWKCAE
ncbi:hypothetical protein D3C78_1569550 [compost metagenome]